MPGGTPTWEEIARDHGRFLYAVAYRLAGNESDAQDLVQEALVRVHRDSRPTGRVRSKDGWLGS